MLEQYLVQRRAYINRLRESLEAADSRKAQRRLEEILGELDAVEEALSFYEEPDGC